MVFRLHGRFFVAGSYTRCANLATMHDYTIGMLMNYRTINL